MTPLKYLRESQVATVREILNLKQQYPTDYDTLMRWCREEMTHNKIEVTEQ